MDNTSDGRVNLNLHTAKSLILSLQELHALLSKVIDELCQQVTIAEDEEE